MIFNSLRLRFKMFFTLRTLFNSVIFIENHTIFTMFANNQSPFIFASKTFKHNKRTWSFLFILGHRVIPISQKNVHSILIDLTLRVFTGNHLIRFITFLIITSKFIKHCRLILWCCQKSY